MRVAVCGSTQRTVQCAKALAADPQFEIVWVVTPPPKPIGRKQVLTPSPLEQWAQQQQQIPIIHVEKSLKPLQSTIESQPAIDFLLVVDFGYLVPQWLLDIPKIAPINVHPSALPKYRGSSPAQFVILYGETDSAVCIMRMTAGLDEGPIIRSIPFSLNERETTESYYQKAFALAAEALPQALIEYAENRAETPQPEKSTTATARRFFREDGYIPYSVIEHAQKGTIPENWDDTSPAVLDARTAQPETSLPTLIDRAVRALTPWPGIWTIVSERKGRTNVRCKILKAHENNGLLIIDEQRFDGE